MGLKEFVFGSSEEISRRQDQEQYQITGRKSLYEAAEPGALSRLGRAGETYPGDLTAPLSGFEQRGLGQLGDYLDRPPASQDPLFQAGREELLKTFGGEYDPEGPYYQAYKTKVMQELTEAKDRLAATTSARDKFFGGGRISATGELEESAVGDLALVLGQLYERERERKLQAVPEATRLGLTEEMLPLQRIEAATTFGAIPRQIEQEGLNREYSEWQRALADLGIPLDVAQGLATYRPDYSYPLYANEPGIFGGQEGTTAYRTGSDAANVNSIANVLARLNIGQN